MTNPITDPLVEVPDTDALSKTVLTEATPDGAVTITINRPAKKNAFDEEVIGALREAFETLHGADHVRVVFLRGAGEAFCAGADLDWMRRAAEWTEDDNRDDAMELARMLKALADIPAMTVALVDGPAFGGGAGLVAACTSAVATKRAQFAFSEVRLGLTPATISPYVIAAIGPRRAAGLFATGLPFTAEHAEKIGLVEMVVEDAAGLDMARDSMIKAMKACAPGAVGDALRLVQDFAHREVDRGLMEETAKRIARRRISDEGQEGVRAFLAKRKPAWAE